MIRGLVVRIACTAFGVLVLASAVTALTASNSVSSTRAGDTSQAVDPNAIKPAECGAITVATRISGSGVVTGTLANDLMTGAAGSDTISALGGDDCVQGHGADDTIDGGPGNDVCIGGPGTDTFSACEVEHQ